MKNKNLLAKCYLFTIILSILFIIGCSNSGNDNIGSPKNIQELYESGNYVSMSTAQRNTIFKGKDVFDEVMKKYQPVIDFYGIDADLFYSLVNTNLSLNNSKVTAPSEEIYSYSVMQNWENTTFVVEYENGSVEELPAFKVMEPDGTISAPGWYKAGNKVKKILAKCGDVANGYNKVSGFLEKYNSAVNNSFFELEPKIYQDLGKLFTFTEKMAPAFKIAAKISQISPYLSTAMGLVSTFAGGPSEMDIVNKKLDYMIDLIKGIYTHLEYIESKLEEIRDVVENKANIQMKLDLKNITNTINSRLQEIENVISYENKKATAMVFRNEINGFIQSYIDYSIQDYDNFLTYKIYNEKDPKYISQDIFITFPLEETTNVDFWASGAKDIVNQVQTQNVIISKYTTNKNDNVLLPFSFEGLQYLQNIIITRLSINSFIEEKQENLEAYNSNTSLTYLNTKNNYIAYIRELVNNTYSSLSKELSDVKNNLNGPYDNTVEKNITQLTTHLSTPFSAPICDFYLISNDLSKDKLEFTPKYTDVKRTWWCGPTNSMLAPKCASIGANKSWTFEPLSITIGSNEPVEIKKLVNEDGVLDDAYQLLDTYYKGQTNKLLEFTAMLAAMEIQLALYLDEEDFNTYIGE